MAESWLPLVSTTCGSGAGEPDQCVIQQAHHVYAGQGAVVDVACDQDHVNGTFR